MTCSCTLVCTLFIVRTGDSQCFTDEYCQQSIIDGVCLGNVCVCPEGYESLNEGKLFCAVLVMLDSIYARVLTTDMI